MSDVHFDYEMVLFIASLISLTAFLISKKTKIQQSGNRYIKFITTTGSYFPIIFLVLSVRSFAFEPFKIPSSSMMPTLLTGDFIYVDKTAYGLKMPVFHTTLIETGHPKHGDIFVFRSVEDPAIDIIKRVIGVPGDHIKYDERTKQVFVNGMKIDEKFTGDYQGFHDDISPIGLTQRTATIDDVNHTILHSNQIHRNYSYTDLVVPDGHYFGMGDNRDFSKDSRVFGLIPEKNIVGKAEFIWMHWRPSAFLQGLQRIGNTL
jgi:signal peptidase I